MTHEAPSEKVAQSPTVLRLGYVLATWFGCGKVPIAPGTAGTAGAIPVYLLLRHHGHWAVLAASLVALIVGVWAAAVVVKDTGLPDPQIVVIDEVAGVLLTWVASPNTTLGLVVGFVLFRIFDQFKPWPANAMEKLPGGWGPMMDDMVAGAYGAAVLYALHHWRVL